MSMALICVLNRSIYVSVDAISLHTKCHRYNFGCSVPIKSAGGHNIGYEKSRKAAKKSM